MPTGSGAVRLLVVNFDFGINACKKPALLHIAPSLNITRELVTPLQEAKGRVNHS